MRIAAASADDDELAHTVGDNRLIIEDIATQHRRLRHLPIPQPSREAFIFFESAWRAAFPQTDAKPPSLCTSDQLDPSEHALSDITVVDQAKLDYASPLAWPALLHEIGHAVIRELRLPGVSNTAQQRNVQNSWLLELGCDYVATLIAGPSFLCDFTWRALMDPAFTDSTERHPAPAVRLSVLQRFSARWLRQDPLFEQVSSLVQSKRQCTESELSHIKGHVSDSFSVICSKCRTPRATLQPAARDVFGGNGDVISEFIQQLDSQLKVARFTEEDFDLAKIIATDLESGIVVGSSHDTSRAGAQFKELSQAIALLTGQGSTRQRRQIGALYTKARQTLRDRPNSLFTIINAAWLLHWRASRTDFDSTLLKAKSPARFAKAWTRFTTGITERDELLLASLETADFHRQIAEIGDEDVE